MSSGIYLPDWDMPKQCFYCPCFDKDDYVCGALDRAIENPFADDGVELDCPLVFIPDNVRLIDANSIGLTNFELYLCCQDENKYKSALEMLLKKIEDAPSMIITKNDKLSE